MLTQDLEDNYTEWLGLNCGIEGRPALPQRNMKPKRMGGMVSFGPNSGKEEKRKTDQRSIKHDHEARSVIKNRVSPGYPIQKAVS